MKFSVQDFFSECLINGNYIFCAMQVLKLRFGRLDLHGNLGNVKEKPIVIN